MRGTPSARLCDSSCPLLPEGRYRRDLGIMIKLVPPAQWSAVMAALRVRILSNRVPDTVQRFLAVHRVAGTHMAARLTSNTGPRLSSAELGAALRLGHACLLRRRHQNIPS